MRFRPVPGIMSSQQWDGCCELATLTVPDCESWFPRTNHVAKYDIQTTIHVITVGIFIIGNVTTRETAAISLPEYQWRFRVRVGLRAGRLGRCRMTIDRRELLGRAMIAAVAVLTIGVRPAFALSESAATDHVRATIDELLSLARDPGGADAKAPALLAIMQQRAAMPQIARFAAGVVWRDMSEDQRTRFEGAFARFLSVVYARRFQEYSGGVGQGGEPYTMNGVVDAGRKGLLVKTSIARPDGPPALVEWLVTDQPGRMVIADIVIEGVSLLITQREEIGGMLEVRGGDVEKLIADLSA